jgi:hypothetical protein
MSLPRARRDGRDERAADRDDVADRRDDITRARDDAADKRDIEADQRDEDASTAADELADRVQRISLQILDRLGRVGSATLDRADWADLTPAAFARLDAYTAEQRRLAGLDRAAVYALLDNLHDAVHDLQRDQHAAGGDRHHSFRDRHHSDGDRRDGRQDRHAAQADRHQAVTERELVNPGDLPPPPPYTPSDVDTPPPKNLTARVAQALDTSRRQIVEGRVYLDGIARRPTPSTDSAPEPSPEPES